eukprot:5297246-Pleurochrysis_carterae.AAC.2
MRQRRRCGMTKRVQQKFWGMGMGVGWGGGGVRGKRNGAVDKNESWRCAQNARARVCVEGNEGRSNHACVPTRAEDIASDAQCTRRAARVEQRVL